MKFDTDGKIVGGQGGPKEKDGRSNAKGQPAEPEFGSANLHFVLRSFIMGSSITMILRSLGRFAGTGLLLAGIVGAHYTWIAPVTLVKGKVAKITIGHGHRFPESEESIAAAQVKAFAVAPSGRRSALNAAKAGKAVTVEYRPAETGTHAIGFVQDRGVMSRTPGGVKPGGRDANQDATQAIRVIRTAVAFASTGKVSPSGRPLGLEIELVPQVKASAVTLQLLRSGRPLAGTAVYVLTAGQDEPKEAGKTNAQGSLNYAIGAALKPPVLFIASASEPAAKGANHDVSNLSTSLYLNW